MNEGEKELLKLIDKVEHQEQDAERTVEKMQEEERRFRAATSLPKSIAAGSGPIERSPQ